MGEWGIMGGFGIVVAAIVAGGLSPWRFLLSQEWSRGGNGGVCRFLATMWATICWRAATIGGFADGFPSSPGPFLRRQESHSDVFALSQKLSGVAAC